MRKLCFLIVLCLVLSACCGKIEENQVTEKMFETISAEEAKEIIDSKDCIILDVREEDEYEEGHIEGAILIPHGEVGERASEILPDKDALILVYCRSGRRSKIASEELIKLGYTNIKEFGGIIDWKYGVVK